LPTPAPCSPRYARLRVPPPLPDVVLGGSRLRAPWEGLALVNQVAIAA
jgi:hypothetical protein